MHPTRSDHGGEYTLQMREANRIISRYCALACNELSIMTNNIYRSTNFYDIRRDDENEIEKQGSFPYAVRYESTSLFQLSVDLPDR